MCTLRVYTSILTKISTLALAPEIAYVGVLKYQQLSFDYEKSFRSRIEGLSVDFSKKCQSFSLILWLQIFGAFDIRNSIMCKTIHQDWPLRVYMSIVQKMSMPYSDPIMALLVCFGIINSFMSLKNVHEWQLRALTSIY